jgi:hypothetical protein
MISYRKISFAFALIATSIQLVAEACSGHHGHEHHADHQNHHNHDDGAHEHCDDQAERSLEQLGQYLWPSAAAFQDAGARCATKDPEASDVARTTGILEGWRRRKLSSRRRLGMIEVPLYIHIFRGSSASQIVSETQIQDQIEVLNGAFAPHFHFALQEIIYTDRDDWFICELGGNEKKFKRQLRRGTSETLNLYICVPGDGLLGWSTLPTRYEANPLYGKQTRRSKVTVTTMHHMLTYPFSLVFVLDGVVVHAESLPGGRLVPYNLGNTATHEIGHWFGLYHTFQGGCNGQGDGIADTPAQASPGYGCPKGRDVSAGSRVWFRENGDGRLKHLVAYMRVLSFFLQSCRFDQGNDPVTNFMDYSDDDCMEEFTTGQFEVMVSSFVELRATTDIILDAEGDNGDEQSQNQQDDGGQSAAGQPAVQDSVDSAYSDAVTTIILSDTDAEAETGVNNLVPDNSAYFEGGLVMTEDLLDTPTEVDASSEESESITTTNNTSEGSATTEIDSSGGSSSSNNVADNTSSSGADVSTITPEVEESSAVDVTESETANESIITIDDGGGGGGDSDPVVSAISVDEENENAGKSQAMSETVISQVVLDTIPSVNIGGFGGSGNTLFASFGGTGESVTNSMSPAGGCAMFPSGAVCRVDFQCCSRKCSGSDRFNQTCE